MTDPITRRAFLKGSAVAAAATAVTGLPRGTRATAAPKAMPTIHLGDLEVSRLLLGSYPFTGRGHPRFLACRAMYDYYKDEGRLFATLDAAAKAGITAVVARPGGAVPWLEIWPRYRDAGGKLRHWVAECINKGDQGRVLLRAARAGADACYIQSGRVDPYVLARDFHTLRHWLETAREAGVPLGLATHRADTLLECERNHLPVDFYFQSLYDWTPFPPDDPAAAFRPADREKALAAVRKVAKPVVVFKVLAAGYHEPRPAFEHTLARLAPKDGLCVGVFTKDDPDQPAENAALVRQLSR